MIIKDHPLPVKRQAELLEIARANVYYLPAPTPDVAGGSLAVARRGPRSVRNVRFRT